MTLALVLACAVARRWPGAALAAAAVPFAAGFTEYALKPSVGEAIGQSFPSGHATSMFALATICAVLLAAPARRLSGGARLLLALMAIGLAAAVAVAMVAIGAHTVTDAAGGAAVGTAVVLACALALDLLASAVGARPRGPALR